MEREEREEGEEEEEEEGEGSCWRLLCTGTATRLKSHIEAFLTQFWI